MKINIVENTVLNLALEDLPPEVRDEGQASNGKIKSKFSINLNFEDKSFFVTFNLSLITPEGKQIRIVHRSKFETDAEINQEFIDSNFPYVNAPAIAYPFVRAFISNLTLNSGYSPIMLPSVNFVALHEKKKNKAIPS